MLSLEVWRVWINHFLTFLVILVASGKLVDRFCFAYSFAYELYVRSPCFDITCGGTSLCGSPDSKVAAQICTTHSLFVHACHQ
jgi:hypothetical protein